MQFEGLEERQRELDQAQRAIRELNGTVTELRYNPDDPASVAAAVRQIEMAVDSILS